MGSFAKKEKSVYWIKKSHIIGSDEFVCSACGHKQKRSGKKCGSCGRIISKIISDKKSGSDMIDEMILLDILFDGD